LNGLMIAVTSFMLYPRLFGTGLAAGPRYQLT
jgi:hypothetical protein